jgi:hypothetical protein
MEKTSGHKNTPTGKVEAQKMRVPDPFSCMFNVAASRAQIATK